MRLEHLNIKVNNIEDSVRFYQTVFPNWKVRGEGMWSVNGKPGRWLHIGDDFQYLTLNANDENKHHHFENQPIGLSHFAFEVSDLQGIVSRLQQAGYEPSGQGAESDHRTNIYFRDPSGFEIEFVQYHSNEISERNYYG